MKKIIALCCLLLVLGGVAKAENWIDLEAQGAFIDADSFRHKGHYIDFDMKYTDVQEMNKALKENKIGISVDADVVSCYKTHIKYDCKNARIKYEYHILYTKDNQILQKWRDNTWEYAKYGEIDADAVKALNSMCNINEE